MADPIVSYGLGAAGFGEPLPRDAGIGLSAACLGLLAAGVIVLARSPLLATAPRLAAPPGGRMGPEPAGR